MTKKIVLVVILVVLQLSAFSQDRIIKKGNRLLDRNKMNEALETYLKVYEEDKNNDILNYQIGLTYFYISRPDKALFHFEKAYSINPKVNLDIHYFLGQVYQLNYQFTKAIEEYNKDLIIIESDPNRSSEKVVVEKFIEECRNGLLIMNEKTLN